MGLQSHIMQTQNRPVHITVLSALKGKFFSFHYLVLNDLFWNVEVCLVSADLSLGFLPYRLKHSIGYMDIVYFLFPIYFII